MIFPLSVDVKVSEHYFFSLARFQLGRKIDDKHVFCFLGLLNCNICGPHTLKDGAY